MLDSSVDLNTLYIKVNDSVSVSVDDFTPETALEMNSEASGDSFCLAFCLSDEMDWHEEYSRTEFHLDVKTGIFYNYRDVRERGFCNPGQHMHGVSIILSAQYFQSISKSLNIDNSIFQYQKSNIRYSYFDISSNFMYVLNQLTACPLKDSSGNLYREAKVMELTALCLYELSIKDAELPEDIKFSASDIEKLKEARRLLDYSLSGFISVKQLSRQIGLNEFKLKKGFPRLFGLPVHSYLVDRKMQKAHDLLERRKYTVAEVSDFVGYSCPSSFSKAFNKKYGFNPSACIG